MANRRRDIPKDRLRTLYVDKGMTPAEIGHYFGCHGITIRNRLIEYGIPLKSQSKARSKYKKRSFDGDDTERAYLHGFRAGDLNVYIPSERSDTVVVRSHSTHEAQNRLVRSLFSRYGGVNASRAKNGKNVHINCLLDKSFSFLLEKFDNTIKEWVARNEVCTLAFIAGYIDAEGSFQINQGRGRFKMDAYDVDIMRFISQYLRERGYNVKLRCIARKKSPSYQGGVWREDLWRITINSALDLYSFIDMIYPYLQHVTRRRGARCVQRNVRKRIYNGTA